jgi:6-phosphogluconolactonase
MVDRGTWIVKPDVEHYFETREDAALAAANSIATALRRRLDHDQATSLVVTGGSSPQDCYAALAAAELPWGRVHIVLSDERWVPASNDDSNEKMIRSTLLIENAAEAQLHPFYVDDADVQERSSTFAEELRGVPSPHASCLLGMGDDGHIASLFADADNFSEGVDASNSQLCIPVKTAASPHARISLTLSALLRSDEIVLLFFGESKRDVYERAKLEANAYPVSRLLHQDRVPVSVFWAP